MTSKLPKLFVDALGAIEAAQEGRGQVLYCDIRGRAQVLVCNVAIQDLTPLRGYIREALSSVNPLAAVF
jgi:hypothetical protein